MASRIKQLFWLSSALLLMDCAAARVKRANINTVIETAESYIGTPYRYGGMSRSGTDCSGLLVNSFAAAGLTLPRSAKGQSKIGKSVSMYEVQPGDLVFFACGDSRWKITHVGIVTEVHGKHDVRFVHASTSKGVIEANLWSDYYQDTFRRARRPKYR